LHALLKPVTPLCRRFLISSSGNWLINESNQRLLIELERTAAQGQNIGQRNSMTDASAAGALQL
jgi:hypothetical protein